MGQCRICEKNQGGGMIQPLNEDEVEISWRLRKLPKNRAGEATSLRLSFSVNSQTEQCLTTARGWYGWRTRSKSRINGLLQRNLENIEGIRQWKTLDFIHKAIVNNQGFIWGWLGCYMKKNALKCTRSETMRPVNNIITQVSIIKAWN